MSPLNCEQFGPYVLIEYLASGSYGAVYAVNHEITNEVFALKLEKTGGCGQLAYEAKILKSLQKGLGFVKLYHTSLNSVPPYVIMDLLGPSIEELFQKQSRSMTVKDILLTALQVIDRIEYLHSKALVHRDIKPDNFAFGTGSKSSLIYLIDFGLGKRYCEPGTKIHIPYSECRSLTGTARFVSINTHLGMEQSRRDDIESISYMLFYLLNGDLPWQGVLGRTKVEKYGKIMELKMSTPAEILCKNKPIGFSSLMNHSRALRFSDAPNYNAIRKNFKTDLENLEIEDKENFDWLKKNDNIFKKMSRPAPKVVDNNVDFNSENDTDMVEFGPRLCKSISEISLIEQCHGVSVFQTLPESLGDVKLISDSDFDNNNSSDSSGEHYEPRMNATPPKGILRKPSIKTSTKKKIKPMSALKIFRKKKKFPNCDEISNKTLNSPSNNLESSKSGFLGFMKKK